MKQLEFHHPDPAAELAWPEEETDISLGSPALAVFTDFRKTRPLTIHPDCSAVEAERLMQEAHVRLKLVVDQSGHFLGVVSLADLNSQEMMKRVAAGFHRYELKVRDFMRARDHLQVLDLAELAEARVADLVNALHMNCQQHCLVVDRQRHRICGVISSSDLARHLRLPIDIGRHSSFFGIFQALHG